MFFTDIYNDPFSVPDPTRTPFQTHLHEIIGSFIFYYTLYWLSPWINTMIFESNYTSLPKKKKLNFDIHVVSMVQCIISIVVIIPILSHPFLNLDPVFNYIPYCGFVSAITIGYFIWDLWVCVLYFDLFGIGFLLHAIGALFMFSVTLRPYMNAWIGGFLAFELSTPFVNLNWYFSRLPAGTVPDKIVMINGLLLMIVFFLVRIVWGFIAVYKVFWDLYAVWDRLPWWLPVGTLVINFTLDGLNLFWFQKMVSIAAKKLKTKKQ